MFDIKILFDLMSDAEKMTRGSIKNTDKKTIVKNQLKKIMGKEYDDYEDVIDSMIDFICYLSHNKKLLNLINKNCCCF